MYKRQAIDLDPENITVHTLTLTRASNLVVEHRAADYADVAAMVEAFHRIPRQTRDQVHVDVIMPHAAGGPVTIQDILRRVAAANVCLLYTS